jgi:uncharacterized SAM-binding protein YcdF (DUF218 family)
MEHAFASVILVTNNYHMPRSLMEMRRYVGAIELQPYPVVNRAARQRRMAAAAGALRVLFTEYVKLIGPSPAASSAPARFAPRSRRSGDDAGCLGP